MPGAILYFNVVVPCGFIVIIVFQKVTGDRQKNWNFKHIRIKGKKAEKQGTS